MKEQTKIRKNLEKQMNEFWSEKEGAARIDLKESRILLFNGGLFQDMDEQSAELHIEDLDDTINYLKRLKNFLNKNNIKTGDKKC